MPKYEPLENRFWRKVDKSKGKDACWPWMGACTNSGYGKIGLPRQRKLISTHRLAYMFFTKELIPDKLLVCHHCDNRKCCNPQHLFLGTHSDNMLDCSNKGRNTGSKVPKPRIQGANHPRTQLDLNTVNKIRSMFSDGMTQAKISNTFGIKAKTVHNIVRRKTWIYT